MTPTDCTRLESAYESHCARLYGEYLDQLDENETLADIEQAFWDALNFNDIGSALADDSAIDGAAFVRAVQKGDSEKVLDLLQSAVQVYIEQWAQRIRPSSQRIWTERLILYCTPTLNSAKAFGRKNSNLQGAMDERIYRDSGRTYCNKRTFFNARDSSTPSTAEQTPRGITRKAGV